MAEIYQDFAVLTSEEDKHDMHNEHGHEEHTEHGHESHAAEEKDVFGTLLNENMGDHHYLSFLGVGKLELPVILVDDGFHFYWNKSQMEEAGQFTYSHHAYVRASDHQPPALDLSITSLVVFQWVTIILLVIGFAKATKHYKKNANKAPKGFTNMIETLFVYIRDEIVSPNVGGGHVTQRLLPYFISLFTFILVSNLLGLIPGGHSPTGNIAVTGALAIIAFIVINFTAIKESGIGAWLHHLLGGAPWWLAFIMVPIEILSLFTKPFALMVRLFANMTGGHVILLSLIGLIFFFETILVSPVTVAFSLFIYFLELLVAFIQAYVFTMLTAVFVGLAIGDHAHEEHAH
jgi:F-type H+-transporting ATPase subunit a